MDTQSMQKHNTGNMSGLRRTRSSFIRSAAVTHCICCVYVFLCVSTNLSLTEQFEILIRGEEKLMWGLLAVSSVSETCSCQTCCIHTAQLMFYILASAEYLEGLCPWPHPLFESCIRSYYRQFLSFPLSFCLLVFCLMSLSATSKMKTSPGLNSQQ